MAKYTVIEDKGSVVVVTNVQGPGGIDGTDGTDGTSTVPTTLPPFPVDGDLWLNPTDEMNVYINGLWEPLTLKTDLSDTAGSLTINAGNF